MCRCFTGVVEIQVPFDQDDLPLNVLFRVNVVSKFLLDCQSYGVCYC